MARPKRVPDLPEQGEMQLQLLLVSWTTLLPNDRIALLRVAHRMAAAATLERDQQQATRKDAAQRRGGRPPGSKNKPKAAADDDDAERTH